MDRHVDQASEVLEKFIQTYPHLEESAMDFFALMCDEIEAGESPSNEYELFRSSLNDLVEEIENGN